MVCNHCGALVSRHGERCTFCGTVNAGCEAVSARCEALLARGIEALRAGRNADAIEHLSALAAEDPDVSDAYTGLGAAWLALGKPDRALAAMRRAEALLPGSSAIKLNVGVLLAQTGLRHEAEGPLRQALALVDRDPLLGDDVRAGLRQRIADELAKLPPAAGR